MTRRRFVVLADQAVFSLGNVVVALLIARSFETAEPFGAFSVALVAYQLVTGGVRSLVGEPLLSAHSHESPEQRQGLISDLVGASLALAALCAIVVTVVATSVGGMAGSALLAFGIVLPFLVVADTWRYVFIVDRAWAALAVDLACLVVVVAVMPFAPDDASVAWFVIVWGLSGAGGAVVGIALCPAILLRRPHPWRWLLDHRDIGSRFFGEFAATMGLGQLLLAGFGSIAGLAALGGVRGAQVFYGPINTAFAGVYLVVVPEGARLRESPAQLRRVVAVASGGLMALAALWMLVGLVLPDSWGRSLLGGVWPRVDDLMIPMGAFAAATSAASGGLYGLRALADAERSLRTRLRSVPAFLACPFVGAALGGSFGFATGLAVAATIMGLLRWQAFGAALSERRDSLATSASPTELEMVAATPAGQVPAS